MPQHWLGHMTAEDQVLLCWPPRLPDLKTCHFLLWGYVKDSFYHLYPRICLSSEDKSLLPPQKSIMTCCSWYEQREIIRLTSAMSQRAETRSTFEVLGEGGTWRVSLSICRSQVTILSTIQAY